MSEASEADVAAVECAAVMRTRLLEGIGQRVVGQQSVVEMLLIALFAGGHCLFVGVPGLAKTLLVATLSELLHLSFSRIQFTPDLMPSDITGTEVLQEDQTTGRRFFRFIHGPIFANLVLADEVNRTPPKTQAALLQAMQEKRVTAGGQTYALNLPFLVMATQNPIEQEGTYPLPEAQLDRFMFQIDVPYPTAAEEVAIVAQQTGAEQPAMEPVVSPAELLEMQQLVRRIPVATHVVEYAVALCRASRPTEPEAPPLVKRYLSWGSGPRGSQALIFAAKAKALLEGNYAARIEDVAQLAPATLQHRFVRNFQAEADGIDNSAIIEDILRCTEVAGFGGTGQR